MWQDCHNHENTDKEDISIYDNKFHMHVFDKNSDNLVNAEQAKKLGLYDHVDGALPFFAVEEGSSSTPSCILGLADSRLTEHTCPQYVAYYEDWYFGTPEVGATSSTESWDLTCDAICKNLCAAYCGTPATVIHASEIPRMAAAGLFPDSTKGAQGDRNATGTSKITPRNMHDIADDVYLGNSYEPDEFDEKIVEHRLGATCKLGRFVWH